MSSITYSDCKDCPHMHKQYLSDEKLAFNASCGLCIIKMMKITRYSLSSSQRTKE